MAGGAYFRLQGRYRDLYEGKIKIEDLDDEEVARGQLRCVDGTFKGRPPRALPADLVNAMKREWLSRAQDTLKQALLESGVGTLVKLSRDDRIDPGVRLRAANAIIERLMGKVPERVTLAAEDPIETLFRKILADETGLVPHEPTAEERELLK